MRELARKIQAVRRAALAGHGIDETREAKLKRHQIYERKKVKLLLRHKEEKLIRRRRRKAVRGASSVTRVAAYCATFVFLSATVFMSLIFAVKFDPPVAESWLIASSAGLIQGWCVMDVLNIVIETYQARMLASNARYYEEVLGGSRFQAAAIKLEDQLSQVKTDVNAARGR